MLIDSNLVIYATQPRQPRLRAWLVEQATHYSVISRLETLGYQQLSDAEARSINAILDQLERVDIDDIIVEQAIGLRRLRKMSLGDALVAASCLVHQLPLATANEKDFAWIDELAVNNPLKDEL
ncbi:type II toxin-antitoxin system VapC family toxin [Thiorhodovibrio frisius]|uniref:Putative nucleic acid-binding protein n=1 Tax=Thiorhodovibrio frisius TaxID=631362 RepID=H8Z0H9_9GAMM|nr:type II toxin-antitoxin system VapC family toxin [Thiorhodovibrio frisius]EIC21280.1 putative nucleic acid-binding protein [Thiorhodovibrio frisius]WPL23858.1 PIN domain protein [Thiorhodovibrio frisius]